MLANSFCQSRRNIFSRMDILLQSIKTPLTPNLQNDWLWIKTMVINYRVHESVTLKLFARSVFMFKVFMTSCQWQEAGCTRFNFFSHWGWFVLLLHSLSVTQDHIISRFFRTCGCDVTAVVCKCDLLSPANILPQQCLSCTHYGSSWVTGCLEHVQF